jgi:predicted nucleic acid-binding protein
VVTTDSFVLIDSNILFDITGQDPVWAEWSIDAFSRVQDGRINPIIYAEICYQASSVEEVDQLLRNLDLGYSELPREALYLASKVFRYYRQRGGQKTSPLPDFFIGAHAAALDIPILTRDVARYQAYFSSVKLISP